MGVALPPVLSAVDKAGLPGKQVLERLEPGVSLTGVLVPGSLCEGEGLGL